MVQGQEGGAQRRRLGEIPRSFPSCQDGDGAAASPSPPVSLLPALPAPHPGFGNIQLLPCCCSGPSTQGTARGRNVSFWMGAGILSRGENQQMMRTEGNAAGISSVLLPPTLEDGKTQCNSNKATWKSFRCGSST